MRTDYNRPNRNTSSRSLPDQRTSCLHVAHGGIQCMEGQGTVRLRHFSFTSSTAGNSRSMTWYRLLVEVVYLYLPWPQYRPNKRVGLFPLCKDHPTETFTGNVHVAFDIPHAILACERYMNVLVYDYGDKLQWNVTVSAPRFMYTTTATSNTMIL